MVHAWMLISPSVMLNAENMSDFDMYKGIVVSAKHKRFTEQMLPNTMLDMHSIDPESHHKTCSLLVRLHFIQCSP